MTLRVIDTIQNRKICLVIVTKEDKDREFLTQKLQRYLAWLSIKCRVFGNTREGAAENQSQVSDVVKWLKEGRHAVAIIDNSSITPTNCEQLANVFKCYSVEPLFLEYSARAGEPSVDSTSQSQKGCQLSNTLSYVKLSKEPHNMIINRVGSYLQTRIVFYILNINMNGKSIWLSRHGESIYNVEEKIGGDSPLSNRGLRYAEKLSELMESEVGDGNLTVWTSTLKRTHETAKYLPYEKLEWKALDELDAGICDGMTYKEIEERFPDDFRARDDDKYQYRYRGGESYADVVNRIEPVIMELERQDNILIITHQAVLRCIYAYFMNVPQDESPWMTIPLHTLIKLTPSVRGVKVTRLTTDVPAVSTYKEKGSSDITDNPEGTSQYANLLTEVSEQKQI
ncbi:bifunctional nucleoside/nucleotide kinase/histidine phosphatase family protein KNAG_0C01120 [Huiozyma naganishii CBS 8797]|uniref:fructose-2,6-bisphosphate 2-phosphatase n=1 Tax=Huiozyma naganishii (strain ATCC MYA-139 / BCRC 22969 / CBS 8797 / KCTC 17520 / NBRC 10181 / NCYC 3082 / Yp74L-3) TaxID=1071383 RepID=J7R315_HUIN7|nr:hypothetical protein KNAG_0C01120 [Kazachstania naganishii CBS 8797]CCK69225.1 hypothetical protein KNAG_0C01120 [Kazachstania naganishii CBS 8797]